MKEQLEMFANDNKKPFGWQEFIVGFLLGMSATYLGLLAIAHYWGF